MRSKEHTGVMICIYVLQTLLHYWSHPGHPRLTSAAAQLSRYVSSSVGGVYIPLPMRWASFHFLPQVSWLSLHNSSKKWGWEQLHPLGQPCARDKGRQWVSVQAHCCGVFRTPSRARFESGLAALQWLKMQPLCPPPCLTVSIPSLTYSDIMFWTPHSGSDYRKIPSKALCKVLLSWRRAKNDRPNLLCLKIMLDI